MRKIILASLLVLLGAFSTSCASMIHAPVMPAHALLVSNYSMPLNTEPEGDLGSKTGEAHVVSILGLITVGEASAKSAAKSGGIKEVKHLDYKFFHFLGIFSRFTVIAHGD